MVRRLTLPQLTVPAAGTAAGLVTGLVDAVLVQGKSGRSELGMVALTWLAVLLTWIAVCCLAALLFSAERLGRLRWVAIAFSGPGLLLLAWAVPAVKDFTRWSAPVVIALWLAAVLALAAVLSRVPLSKSRFTVRWGAFAVVTLIALGIVAADLRLRDWLEPEAAQAGSPASPNVVLIFLDATRYDDSLGDGTGQMPSLARFAARSVAFDDAWAPVPWTDPSHRAVLTGVRPWLKADGESVPMLSQRFRRKGYATAAIFSNIVLASFTAGFDEFTVSRGSVVCRSGIGSLFWRSVSYGGPPMPVCSRMDAAEVTARAQRFIRRTKRPYFLTLNYLDPHDPYYVPRRCRDAAYRAATRNERMSVTTARGGRRRPSPEVSRKLHEQYRAAVRCMDVAVGDLLETLQREPNTIVAVVGDHGEQFGEHGMGGHGNSVYRQVLHVPLVLRVPGWPARRIAETVSIVELHDSIVAAVEGRAAEAPLLTVPSRGPAVAQFSYTSGRRNAPRSSAFSAAMDGYHLILRDDGSQELYRYRDDPGETLRIDPRTVPEVFETLHAVLRRERSRQRGTAEFKALGYMQ